MKNPLRRGKELRDEEHRRHVRPRPGLVVERLEERALLAVLVPENFTGNTLTDAVNLGDGVFAPPDTMGAVGPNQVVQLTNGVFAVYDKTTGALVGSKTTDTTFWTSKVGLSFSGGLTDTRILYDPSSQRWFATELTTANTGNKVLLGRSDTSDATGTWKGVSFTADSGFGDFDSLGLDADAVYVGTNDFTNGSSTGTFKGVSLFSIPKADLVASPPTLAHMASFQDQNANTRGFTLQGVVNLGSSNGHGVVIAVDNQSFGKIDRTTVNNPGAAGATLSATTVINVASTAYPPQAKQPDGTTQLDTGDDRYSGNVVQVGNLIYMVHNIGVSNRAALRWTILNESTNAVVQEGTISDPNYDFFYPSIAANAQGEVVIGFNRSGTGASDYISSYAVAGTTTNGVVSFGAPILLKAGLASYHLFGGSFERWGDFSATVVDPSDPNSFWTFQEFPQSSSLWATQVSEVRFDFTAPTVTSINRLTPAGQTTNASSVTYRVTFSEHVNNVSTADFTLTPVSGTLTGESITSVSASSGTTIDVTVNTGTSGNGDLRLDVVVPGATITDDAGIALATSFTTGQVYSIDHTPPTISSVAAVTPNPRSTPVSTDNVVFSEPINLATFTSGALLLTLNGSSVPLTSAVTTSLVSGSTYQISGLDSFTAAAGNYVLTVNATGVQDLAGNTGTGSASVTWTTTLGSSATFLASDATTQGSWKGAYGADGSVLAGDANSPPAYATLAFAGQSLFTWAGSTADPRALQKSAPGSTDRIAATWYSGNQFTVDVSLTDGQTHRLALYALDWDGYNGGRSEQIDILDAATGAMLSSRTLNAFQNGVYLSWTIGGHVIVRVTNLNSSSNAVLSGLFLGAAQTTTTNSATFLASDATTQGSWKGAYGADGSVLAGDANSPPAYATLAFAGQSPYTWAGSTADPRALQKSAPGSTDRIAATWYSGNQFTVDVALTDGQAHRLAIYALDWDSYNGGRNEQIDILDATTGAVLSSRTLSAFQNGVYLSWTITGHVTVRVTNLNPSSNAVLSGLFLG
jgi:hypothetical protein